MESTTLNPHGDGLPSLLKIPQVATDLSVSRTTVYELLRTDRLRGVKIGKAIRITRQSLNAFKESLTEAQIKPS